MEGAWHKGRRSIYFGETVAFITLVYLVLTSFRALTGGSEKFDFLYINKFNPYKRLLGPDIRLICYRCVQQIEPMWRCAIANFYKWTKKHHCCQKATMKDIWNRVTLPTWQTRYLSCYLKTNLELVVCCSQHHENIVWQKAREGKWCWTGGANIIQTKKSCLQCFINPLYVDCYSAMCILWTSKLSVPHIKNLEKLSL